LTRALAAERHLPLEEAELYVHDVMNVFMCTGYTRDTHQYFMKASPVRPGDLIEFFAELDLLVALSACPGGDCGASHSDDSAKCYPLKVEVPASRERVSWLAVTTAERVFSLAWSSVKWRRRQNRRIVLT
jgi:uncharacterized protein YcgI (DUF1989 family)